MPDLQPITDRLEAQLDAEIDRLCGLVERVLLRNGVGAAALKRKPGRVESPAGLVTSVSREVTLHQSA